MNPKHTPGPWRAGVVGPAPRYVIMASTGSEPIAMTYGQETQEADATLIAAAPEMLEALREFLAWSDSRLDSEPRPPAQISARARAAIAKATGGAE